MKTKQKKEQRTKWNSTLPESLIERFEKHCDKKFLNKSKTIEDLLIEYLKNNK